MDEKKTIGERSIYSQSLVDLCKHTSPGDVITYEQMEQAIGMECRAHTPGYGYWRTAQRVLQREHNIVMDNLENVGYKHRFKDEVAVESVGMYGKKIKRFNQRMKHRLDTLADGWDALEPRAKVHAVMTKTLLAFTDHTLKARNVERLEGPAGSGKPLGFNQTIDLFKGPKEPPKEPA